MVIHTSSDQCRSGNNIFRRGVSSIFLFAAVKIDRIPHSFGRFNKQITKPKIFAIGYILVVKEIIGGDHGVLPPFLGWVLLDIVVMKIAEVTCCKMIFANGHNVFK